MTTIEKVLVAGGGIAGLTLAAALGRRGITCDVVDPRPAPAGASITLLNRAIDALDDVGVLEAVAAAGVVRGPAELFAYYDATGTLIASPSIPPRPPSDKPEGIIVYRPELSRILASAAAEHGAVVRHGVALSGLQQHEESVTASFDDGSTATYDLVVGADGIRSTTRRLVFGDAVSPQYSGTTMMRCVVDDVPDVGPEGFYQSGYLIVTLRLRDGRVYIATGRDYPTRPGLDQGEARRLVLENLRTFTAPLMNAVADRITDRTPVLVNDYDWLLLPAPWHSGRVVVLGDAAHATTAHLASGGGMAMEDAVVLAQELGDGAGAGGVTDALRRFTDRRFERSRLVVETSVAISELQQAGEPVARQNALRGQAMRALAAPY